jgi:hypothetical protein
MCPTCLPKAPTPVAASMLEVGFPSHIVRDDAPLVYMTAQEAYLIGNSQHAATNGRHSGWVRRTKPTHPSTHTDRRLNRSTLSLPAH